MHCVCTTFSICRQPAALQQPFNTPALLRLLPLLQRDPSMAPCPLSIHRLMLVGSLLATKLLDDKRHSNAFWARVGGVPLPELNALELRMMSMLDHRLLVTPEVLRRYIRQLQVCFATRVAAGMMVCLVGCVCVQAFKHVGFELNVCCKLHIGFQALQQATPPGDS